MKATFETELYSAIFYIFFGFLLMSIVIIVFFYKSRKKIVEKELEKKDLEINHQKQLLHSIIITQEEERKRIAQDLHDDISSKLNIVSLNSHLLKTKNINEKEIEEITNNIIELSKKALDSSRLIAHNLMPPVLEKFGLNAALEELSEEFERLKSVQVFYSNTINFSNFNNEVQLNIFRIIQELLNNSIRHGKATEIKISFDKKGSTNICQYSDNGIGFDMNDTFNQKGLGMKNIESRLIFINGKFEIKSSPNNGFHFLINF
jgi:signal transduction histidine kinase